MGFAEWVDKHNVCIIMRGLPGAGKSYKVRALLVKFGGDEGHVFSADKFWEHLATEEFIKRYSRKPDSAGDMKVMGELYKKFWHPARLGAAHRYCMDQFQAAVDLGITPVIVDNTNTTTSQFKPYFKYAEDHDYRVQIEEPDSPWWKDARDDLGNTKIKYSKKLQKLKEELLEHGQHGVPADAIEKLIDKVWHNVPGGTGKYVTFDQVFPEAKKKNGS